MAWFKKLQKILDNKREFKRFLKLAFTVVSLLAFCAYFLFVFNWNYSKKTGLTCGGKPIEVEIKKGD